MTIWEPVIITMQHPQTTDYSVQVIGQPVTSGFSPSQADVIFTYGDLINRAIQAKKANPKLNVTIDFAIYRMARRVYIGFDSSDPETFRTVTGYDHGKGKTEKLLYSLLKAARAEVRVRLLVQKDGRGGADSDDISDLTDYLNDPDNWGGEYGDKSMHLAFRHVTWGVGSSQQMHNKFMLLSYVEDREGTVHHSCTYTTTANIDPWLGPVPKKNLMQTGIVVLDHAPLHQHYRRYFNLLWKHCGDYGAFKKAVLDAHRADETLNYSNPGDPCIKAYFYPVKDAWDPSFNPVAEMLQLLPQMRHEERFIKMNMAFLRKDFWEEFCTRVPSGQGQSRLNVAIKTHDDGSQTGVFGIQPGVNYPAWVNSHENRRKTHAKNIQFMVYGEDEKKRHVSITGSVNAKGNGYLCKANNALMLTDPPGEGSKAMYSAFRAMFNEA